MNRRLLESPGQAPRWSDLTYGRAIVLIVVASGVLRFANITAQSLWGDEGYTLEAARSASLGQTVRHLRDCNTTDCFSPLYPMVLHLFIRCFGESVLALRALSAICGVMAVGALLWAARKLFDAPTALLAGSLVALSSFAIWYSQDARSYSLLILLTSAELCGLALCLESAPAVPQWRHRLVLASSIALGIFGSILFLLSAASLCAAQLLSQTDRRRWWATWWPSVLAGVPPLLVFGIAQTWPRKAVAAMNPLQQNGFLNLVYSIYGQLVGTTFGPPQAALRGADKLSALRGHETALACAGTLALLLGIIVVWAFRLRTPLDSRWKSARLLATSIVIGAALSIALGLISGINWQPRHSFFLFPPVVLLVSFSARELAGARPALGRVLVGLALLLFCGTNLWGLYNYWKDPRYGKDDYRGAAAYLIQAAHRGQPTALLAGSAVLLRYYGDTSTVDLSAQDKEGVVRSLVQLSQARGDLLIALNREFYWQGGIGVSSALDSVFEIREHQKLQYFDVYRLLRR